MQTQYSSPGLHEKGLKTVSQSTENQHKQQFLKKDMQFQDSRESVV